MMRRRGGGWGNQANDARDDDERFSTTSSSSSFGLNTKNTKTKKTTLTTKKKRILTMRRLVAMIIAVLALVQILVLVGITLSMEEDDDTHVAWTAEHAWTKSTPGNIIFAKRRRRSKTNKKKRTTMMMMKEEEEENENGTVVFEDVARDVDMSPRYEEKMKLNPFGYVYWHRDRGEGVVNWHASLAEVMRFARAHRRTIVSPCARNGSLKPCVYDTDDVELEDEHVQNETSRVQISEETDGERLGSGGRFEQRRDATHDAGAILRRRKVEKLRGRYCELRTVRGEVF